MATSLQHGQKTTGNNRHPGSAWIDQNRASLADNEWVAADASGLVASHGSYDGLMARLNALHRDLAEVAVAFITTDSV